MLFKCIVKGKKQVRDCYNSLQSHDHILQKNKNQQTQSDRIWWSTNAPSGDHWVEGLQVISFILILFVSVFQYLQYLCSLLHI